MKQVIVVNRSLGLPKGKLAAQVAHAAVGAFLAATAESQATWLEVGMPTIVVYAADADARMQLEARAQQMLACLVRNAGRTVLSAGIGICGCSRPLDRRATTGVTSTAGRQVQH